jgi:hypothetical protein
VGANCAATATATATATEAERAHLQRTIIERFLTLADTTFVTLPPAVPPSSLSFYTMS